MIDRVSSNGLSQQMRVTNLEDTIKAITADSDVKIQSIGEREAVIDPRMKKQLEEIVQGMNKFMQPTHTSLKFELHEKLNQYFVKVIDDNTKEVVREIPPKKLLDMYAAMTEFLGILVDKKI